MQIEDLERLISLEIVTTEKRRLEIFLGILIVGLLLLIVNVFFFPAAIASSFSDERSIEIGYYFSIVFILFLTFSRWMVVKMEGEKRPLSLVYKIYSTFIESILPFVWLFLIMSWERNVLFLDSPIVYLFLPIIIVSALHLDFWVSLLNGILIALMYVLVSYWAFENFDSSQALPPLVYYTKAIVFLMSGVCAGLVAVELKKRLTISLESEEEKDSIEKMFSQQVSKEVVNALKAEQQIPAKVQATVLFLDIRNFTHRVQYLEPLQVNEFQNKIFGPFIDIVLKNQGVINQLMGDGLMATFATDNTKPHPERAFMLLPKYFQG